MGTITISLNTRKGSVRRSTYSHNYTINDVQNELLPGTFYTSITALENAFVGGVTLSDGVYRKTTLSFDSEIEDGSTPTIQTHEEKVVLAAELYGGAPFPNKDFSVSVPMPDLVNDFVFPAGTDRINANDFSGNLSVNAIAWVNNVLDHYLNHNNPNGTWSAARALYVELIGTSV